MPAGKLVSQYEIVINNTAQISQGPPQRGLSSAEGNESYC